MYCRSNRVRGRAWFTSLGNHSKLFVPPIFWLLMREISYLLLEGEIVFFAFLPFLVAYYVVTKLYEKSVALVTKLDGLADL